MSGSTDIIRNIALSTNKDNVALVDRKLKKLPMKDFLDHLNPSLVMILTLSNNKIHIIEESHILQFTKLQSLNLFGNQLKALPANMSGLSCLEYLTLSHNKLKELPRGFGGFAKLRVLDLSMNYLKELPPQLGKITTLTELYLSDNKLTLLPNEIGNLVQLQILSLSSNHLEILPEGIGNLVNLKSLFVQNNQLIDLPAKLACCKSIETLELFKNPLHPAITDALKTGIQYLFVLLERPDYLDQLKEKPKRKYLFRVR